MNLFNRIGSKLARAARDPRGALTGLRHRAFGPPIRAERCIETEISNAPAENIVQMQAYAELAAQAGLDRLYLVLSFDCDTDEDAELVESLDDDLNARGIRASYAVPGAQLVKAPETYARLAARGSEFLNHGAQPHAEWREDRYYGVTFYNEMHAEHVRLDIQKGHSIVTQVTGKAPVGFRAPHFGCFQDRDQLGLIYETVSDLGYQYCSTTIPACALARGPVYRVEGLHEIPVFGSFRNPPTVLDSWTYLKDYKNYALKNEYFELFAETVNEMLARGMPGLLCYYADPSHVSGQKPFLDALDLIAAQGVPSVRLDEVISLAGIEIAPAPSKAPPGAD